VPPVVPLRATSRKNLNHPASTIVLAGMPPALLLSLLLTPSASWAAPVQEPVPSAEDEPPARSGRTAPLPTAPEVLVTAAAHPQDFTESTSFVDSLDREEILLKGRSLPELLEGLPGVLVQKTAWGQTSPFIRGFTGYSTLLLVDGIRLNHAAMRSGPNQYWSTVDAWTVDRLEVVRGPSSVLYGSDAVGGTVNAVTRRAPLGQAGGPLTFGGASYLRMANAENSTSFRTEATAYRGDRWGFLGGVTSRNFGDLENADRVLPYTGYDEVSADGRLDYRLGEDLWWTLAFQTFRQEDVPRTHKTVFAVPYRGTSVGSELLRDQDQRRDLVYSRWSWADRGGAWDEGEITLSWQRHDESRYRERDKSGSLRTDRQGFTLDDYGFLARMRSEETGFGTFSWGVESHLQTADSFRVDFQDGAFKSESIQGPIGDDSTYVDLAAYVQDEIPVGSATLVPGVRLTRISADSDRVANPDPTGPAVIGVSNDWTALTGSVRLLQPVGESMELFGGVSQGFRAPSLSDLTALDATSAVETPSPGLEPEYFVQAELGSRGAAGGWHWQAALWRTWIRDLIVQAPTGALIDGTPEVQKSNAGDGWMHGVELELARDIGRGWSAFVLGSWMDGELQNVDPTTGATFDDVPSRMAPTQARFGTRWRRRDGRQWFEASAWAVDAQNKLAARDVTDTQRIPPGGTPGYTVVDLWFGWEVRDDVTLRFAVENLFDKLYRVHGSGVDAPGRNVVLSVEVRF